jgi:hypothetical protein
MKTSITMTLCVSLACSSAVAQMGRRGGGRPVAVQNRSVGASHNFNNNANANVNRNYNNNANVNRNVNVNQNVNVNRNVNVNNNYHGGGCYNCGGYYNDNSWNWGSFAAGAAAGAVTGAVVASAAHSSSTQTVVVQAPEVGTVVPALPGGCSTVATNGAVFYNCSNVYYRPYYQGTTLVYQVATYP